MTPDDINVDLITFSKPKKSGEYLVSKIKCSENLQFPKMTVSADPTHKGLELEFKNQTGYNKKVYDVLVKIDKTIMNVISDKSLEWFDKKIPLDALEKMYKPFINESKINLTFETKKTEILTNFIDSKNETLGYQDIVKGSVVECIAQMKYIVFSKETSFVVWQVDCVKLHKKINRVPRYGFIEDPDDNHTNSDDEVEIYSFF